MRPHAACVRRAFPKESPLSLGISDDFVFNRHRHHYYRQQAKEYRDASSGDYARVCAIASPRQIIGEGELKPSRFLKDLELYHAEKPYFCLMPATSANKADNEQMDNLEFESHHNIRIDDIRPLIATFKLDEYGFEVVQHTSRYLDIQSDKGLKSTIALAEYQLETEIMLTSHLEAAFVKCYDIVMRRNITFDETVFDLKDQMHVIGPARGAHNGNFQICYIYATN